MTALNFVVCAWVLLLVGSFDRLSAVLQCTGASEGVGVGVGVSVSSVSSVGFGLMRESRVLPGRLGECLSVSLFSSILCLIFLPSVPAAVTPKKKIKKIPSLWCSLPLVTVLRSPLQIDSSPSCLGDARSAQARFRPKKLKLTDTRAPRAKQKANVRVAGQVSVQSFRPVAPASALSPMAPPPKCKGKVFPSPLVAWPAAQIRPPQPKWFGSVDAVWPQCPKQQASKQASTRAKRTASDCVDGLQQSNR